MSEATSTPLYLRPEDTREIGRIGRLRLPREACGVLLPHGHPGHQGKRVLEMPNRCLGTTDEFEMKGTDIGISLIGWEATDDDWDNIVIWHTHPGGQIGPSKGDVEQRVEGFPHLVVTIKGDETLPTWY